MENFLNWFAQNMDTLRIKVTAAMYDEDLFIEVAEKIARKNVEPKDPTGYFLRSYRNEFINIKRMKRRTFYLEEEMFGEPLAHDGEMYAETCAAELVAEILRFNREWFDGLTCAIYEVYATLASHEKAGAILRTSEITGIPRAEVSETVRAVNDAIRAEFARKCAITNKQKTSL